MNSCCVGKLLGGFPSSVINMSCLLTCCPLYEANFRRVLKIEIPSLNNLFTANKYYLYVYTSLCNHIRPLGISLDVTKINIDIITSLLWFKGVVKDCIEERRRKREREGGDLHV